MMDEQNNFKLVRRPASAVEKATSGVKRILSGMVADTLAQVKSKKRGKLRVVVLDDVEGPRRASVAMVHGCWQHGEEILEFDDGDDAWQEISNTDPDLFITDITHAGISCHEMLSRLAERKVKFPILVVSAVLALHEDVRRDWSPDLNVFFLPKPWTAKEFHAVLEEALKIIRNTERPPETNAIKTLPLTIVHIDDEEMVLKIVKQFVVGKYKDVTVKSFTSGNEAWEELSRTSPDLLITDDKMADLNGEEIVRRLVDMQLRYPIIVTSGWSPTENWVREFQKRHSAISFLHVPFGLDEFCNALSEQLGPRLRFKNNKP